MFGMQANKETKAGFAIGAGVLWEPNVKMLGDGIREGQALPVGETEVRFKKESKRSFLITLAYTF